MFKFERLFPGLCVKLGIQEMSEYVLFFIVLF